MWHPSCPTSASIHTLFARISLFTHLLPRSCLQFPGGNAILLGKDKAFTYDSVYGENAGQSSIFDDWVVGLVDGCFQGVHEFSFLRRQFTSFAFKVTTPRCLHTGRLAAGKRTLWVVVARTMSPAMLSASFLECCRYATRKWCLHARVSVCERLFFPCW